MGLRRFDLVQSIAVPQTGVHRRGEAAGALASAPVAGSSLLGGSARIQPCARTHVAGRHEAFQLLGVALALGPYGCGAADRRGRQRQRMMDRIGLR